MYYPGGPEIQADSLQTLYLMNPNYSGYSDTQPQQQTAANMLFLNYATGMPNGQQHLVGVPLQVQAAAFGSGNRKLLEQQHEVHSSRAGIPHFHQSLWGPVEQTANAAAGGGGCQPHIPTGVAASRAGGGATEVAAQMGFHRPTQQGLSLSLSPQQPGYGPLAMDNDISMQAHAGIVSARTGGNLRGSGGSSSSVSAVSNGLPGAQGLLLGSQYLKTAQQLLDELVNVGEGIKAENMEKGKEKAKKNKILMALTAEASTETKAGSELTTSQKQEIQMKRAKLISMLDEVEGRYRQYHHQMQIVLASFEQATGVGSARSYTQLALQTISKQFRCLKDAISAQIKAANKSLGEEEGLGGKFEGSRLKFVDQQLRQQRALQNLGIMQNNNAWRPQRGLPEKSVSVLRAWLFEHFLHPYPKDSDKQMLAKQTGLNRSQVSNWFINARVRLWKPMVEEMYAEEMKNQKEGGSESHKELGSNSNAQRENDAVKTDQFNTLHYKQNASPAAEISNSSAILSPTESSPQDREGFGLVCLLNMEGNVGKNPKKMRTDMQKFPSSILSAEMETKFGETKKRLTNNFSSTERQTKDSFSLMANNVSNGDGYGTFTVGELGQFNPEQLTAGFHGNGVSLTLGLPPSGNLPLSDSEQNFFQGQSVDLGSRLEVEAHYDRVNKPQASHSGIVYETIDFENRKRFAAPLLPDFVA